MMRPRLVVATVFLLPVLASCIGGGPIPPNYDSPMRIGVRTAKPYATQVADAVARFLVPLRVPIEDSCRANERICPQVERSQPGHTGGSGYATVEEVREPCRSNDPTSECNALALKGAIIPIVALTRGFSLAPFGWSGTPETGRMMADGIHPAIRR